MMSAQAFAQKGKPAPAKKPVSQAPVLKNGTDSLSYALGADIARNLKAQGITDLNTEKLKLAFDDILKNRKPILDQQTSQMTLQQKLQEAAAKKSNQEKEKGKAFLEANKKRQGVNTLPNGLQYEILDAGKPNGAKPTASDTVVVDYVGTLIDGQEFDSSVKRGQPATFGVGQVIRGWTEILQMMPVGAKWKVYIPSELGYGDRGAGQMIKPGSTLIFLIDLLEIKPSVKQ